MPAGLLVAIFTSKCLSLGEHPGAPQGSAGEVTWLAAIALPPLALHPNMLLHEQAAAQTATQEEYP